MIAHAGLDTLTAIRVELDERARSLEAGDSTMTDEEREELSSLRGEVAAVMERLSEATPAAVPSPGGPSGETASGDTGAHSSHVAPPPPRMILVPFSTITTSSSGEEVIVKEQREVHVATVMARFNCSMKASADRSMRWASASQDLVRRDTSSPSSLSAIGKGDDVAMLFQAPGSGEHFAIARVLEVAFLRGNRLSTIRQSVPLDPAESSLSSESHKQVVVRCGYFAQVPVDELTV